jgi:hypothetical protein
MPEYVCHNTPELSRTVSVHGFVFEKMNTLNYEGCNFFRQRLVMAILSGKSVKIKKIRSKDDNPGLRGKFL